MIKSVDNLIGGQKINLSKKYFAVHSQFYEDFCVMVADASVMDISIALSNVKKGWNDCQSLGFTERARILEKAASILKFNETDIDSIVKLIGMPKKYVEQQIEQIPEIMSNFSKTIVKRYGLLNDNLGTDFIENNYFHKIEFRLPKKGFVYAITPGNDPRATALVSTILVLLGIPGIIKPSKTDVIIPSKIIESIIQSGYPKNGLNVVFFDSNNSDSSYHNFKICDEAAVIWPFGDENTVDNLLRLERHTKFDIERFLKHKHIKDLKKEFTKFTTEIQNSTHNSINQYLVTETVDHFSSKLVLRHASGRCAGILDSDFDLNIATKLIIDSSMRWPIGCNSMKSVFVVESVFDEIAERLKKEFKLLDKNAANPLNKNTEVGYVDRKTVSFLEKRLNELKVLNHIKILYGGREINPFQLTPFLISTNDFNSELLINEIPGYILCLTKVKSFYDAVAQINKLTDNNFKLAVSYFTNNKENMRLPINAHHIKINDLTTNIEGIVHEGNDYIMQLTRPHIIHINKKGLKEHPYREK